MKATLNGSGVLANRIRARSLLLFVVACLAGSAMVRLAGSTGQALAQGVSGLIPAAITPQDAAGPETPVVAARMKCPEDSELNIILESLSTREATLTERVRQQRLREATLAAAEERITQRLQQLEAAEAKLTASMARTATAAESDVSALVAVYAAMKPKDAALLFEAMASDFAAGFLVRMRPDTAAAILSGLSAPRAYAISAILAGRNADVPVPPDAAEDRTGFEN